MFLETLKSVQMPIEHDPLTTAEIMSPLSYEKHRECFLWLGRQQKRRRRLRLNDYFSILFESRYTVWLQSQEEARWHLQQNPQQVEQILAANNPLLAPVGELRACLFIDNATSTSGIANLEGISISTFNLQLLSLIHI